MEVGAVAAMRYVKDGIKAARLVMLYTEHTMLAGDQASAFAISMGLPGPSNLSSPESIEKWTKWRENHCQPNFRKNVLPTNSCGPYHPKQDSNAGDKTCLVDADSENIRIMSSNVDFHNHDTISMAIFDKVCCFFFPFSWVICLIVSFIKSYFGFSLDTLLLVHQQMVLVLRSRAG